MITDKRNGPSRPVTSRRHSHRTITRGLTPCRWHEDKNGLREIEYALPEPFGGDLLLEQGFEAFERKL